jgi:hypothetical protein
MGKECFTCANKICTELSQDERKELKEQYKKEGKSVLRVPEMLFHCDITKEQINQTDPACEHYQSNKDMVDIRKMLSDKAKELRKELNK